MTADQNAPKPGDVFQADYRNGDESVEVKFVDGDGSVFYRYKSSPSRAGNGYMCTAELFAAHFTSTPEPLITEPVTLYQRDVNGESMIFVANCPTGRFNTGRSITLMPDGTWHEGEPS